MTAMTHDDFLQELGELDFPVPGRGRDWSDLLSPAAARHASACEDCARTAEALASVAADETALFDEPPEAYWQDFEQRLSSRLAMRPASAAPPRRSLHARLLQVAAAIVVVAGVAALLLPQDRRRESAAGAVGLETLDEALAAWSDASLWDDEVPRTDLALAWPETEEDLPELLGSPVDLLHDTLSLELDDAQAAELARRLRAEISS